MDACVIKCVTKLKKNCDLTKYSAEHPTAAAIQLCKTTNRQRTDKAKPHVNEKHSIASSCTLVKGDSCCDAMEA